MLLELEILRFKLETHNRNGGSTDPYNMTHEVNIKARVGGDCGQEFHVVDDDEKESEGSIGTTEKVLKQILALAGISESQIPVLDYFHVPAIKVGSKGASSEVELEMYFKTPDAFLEIKGKGNDIVSLSLRFMVEAYNRMIR